MSTEKKSIFDLIENFRGSDWESPLGDWLAESEKKQEEEKQRTQEISDNKNNRVTMVKSNGRVQELKYSLKNINNIVWKLGTTFSNKFFLLHDKNGNVIKYTKEDDNYEKGLKDMNIQLPIGTKVIVIDNADIKGNLFKRILLFWKGVYREGYIPYSAFEKQNLDSDENSLELFINDAERILYEVEIRNDASHSTILQNAYRYVKEKIAFLKENNNTIYSDILNTAVANYYSTESVLYRYNHIDALNKVLDFLHITFKQYLDSNKVVIVPISQDWFELNKDKDEKLKKLIDELKSKYIYTDFNGEVGNVKSHSIDNTISGENIEMVVPYLLQLSDIVNGNKMLKDTPEGKWITDNTNLDRLKAANKSTKGGFVILLGKDIWDKDVFSNNYAGFIGVNNSFGPLYAIPLHTILIHEFDQGNGLEYIKGDTHIGERSTLQIYDEFMRENSTKFNSESIVGQPKEGNFYKIDALYQLHACHGLIFLNLFLKKYIS
jgi:hypothetical protein